MSEPDPTRWLGYVVENDENFVYLKVEGPIESYTVEQARGIAAAIEQAADAAERGGSVP